MFSKFLSAQDGIAGQTNAFNTVFQQTAIKLSPRVDVQTVAAQLGAVVPPGLPTSQPDLLSVLGLGATIPDIEQLQQQSPEELALLVGAVTFALRECAGELSNRFGCYCTTLPNPETTPCAICLLNELVTALLSNMGPPQAG